MAKLHRNPISNNPHMMYMVTEYACALGTPLFDLILPDVIHQHGSQYPGDRPGGQQPAVDGADLVGAEHVAQVGRDGGETAAIHRENDAEGRNEQPSWPR